MIPVLDVNGFIWSGIRANPMSFAVDGKQFWAIDARLALFALDCRDAREASSM